MKRFILLSLLAFSFLQAKLSCDYVYTHKSSIFIKKSVNIEEIPLYCELSLRNQEATARLYELANTIRGSNSACMGTNYFSSLRAFDILLLKIALVPKEFQKELATAPLRSAYFDKLRAYFRYWAYQSYSNFMLYNEFWKSYNFALAPLTSFFEQNYDEGSAIFYATNALNEFLNRAVGGTKSYKDISKFSKLVANKNNDLSKIKDYIYTNKPSLAALNTAFQSALLNKRSKNIIAYFLKLGLNINQGYESALFFALNSYENVELLLSFGARVDYSNAFGKTALFYAVENNLLEVAELLIKNGADVNKRYINKSEKEAISNHIGASTPYFITLCALEHTRKNVLMAAAAYADVNMLKLLISYGAKLDFEDDLGFNALDFALLANKKENAIFLSSLGLKPNSSKQ